VHSFPHKRKNPGHRKEVYGATLPGSGGAAGGDDAFIFEQKSCRLRETALQALYATDPGGNAAYFSTQDFPLPQEYASFDRDWA